MTRLGPIPAYLTASTPKRGECGRGRPKSVAHRCECGRILLPHRGLWPWHFSQPVEGVWCKWSDEPYPVEVSA